MASSDSQIDKPQRGRPKRAELLDVNINTGAQSFNTEWRSFFNCEGEVWFCRLSSSLELLTSKKDPPIDN